MRRHWFLWAAAAVVLVAGLLRLRLDVDVLNLLPAELPSVQGLKLQQQFFGSSKELLITVESSQAEEAERAARNIAELLRAQTNLVRSAHWQAPWLESPTSTTELLAYLWLNQPPAEFGRMTNRFEPRTTTTLLESAAEQLTVSLSPNDVARLTFDPLRLSEIPGGEAPGASSSDQVFMSEDGAFRVIFVEAASDLKNYKECTAWLEAVRSVVNDKAVGSGVTVRYTGSPAFVSEIAGGMEGDMKSSVGTTMIIIALIFWWLHRRWLPLLWLLALMAFTLALSLALGGFILGSLNVVSLGFAAILLGLGVEYGMVLYQHALHNPGESVQSIRKVAGPGIVWSAIATSGAFALLNLAGLPGLAQLGTLVCIGIIVAATVMLAAYLPPLLKRLKRGAPDRLFLDFRLGLRAGWAITVLLFGVGLATLLRGLPDIDATSNSLRPRRSAAYETMERMNQKLGRTEEPGWLIVEGKTESAVSARLGEIRAVLADFQNRGQITRFDLPDNFWPKVEHQHANRTAAAALASRTNELRDRVLQAGFTDEALRFTLGMIDEWNAINRSGELWPRGSSAEWVLNKATARQPDNFHAMGLVYFPRTASGAAGGSQVLSALRQALPRENVWLASWELLGQEIVGLVQRNLWRVMIPLAALIVLCLWFAFRQLREVLMSVATLAFSLFCLVVLMRLAGWKWNLMNMMALPLLLGAGIDYAFHMQLALLREGGNTLGVRQSVGRALFLCAATNVAGFGSNVLASNGGLASLGQVCAAGTAMTFLCARYLLPVWWETWAGPKKSPA